MKKEDLKKIVPNDGESYTIIETKPNGERIEHGIFWDLDACTSELERLCFSGKYPKSKWSFITSWSEI